MGLTCQGNSADGSPVCYQAQNAQLAPDPPWTYLTQGPTEVRVTDGFPSGDSFTLFDRGVLRLTTPPKPVGPGCEDDPDRCYVDETVSHAFALLEPGLHEFTIRADVSAEGTGAAFFKVLQVVDVPEPSGMALMLAGLTAAGAVRRWARS